jgi:methionine-rich copper-binding protein CopC
MNVSNHSTVRIAFFLAAAFVLFGVAAPARPAYAQATLLKASPGPGQKVGLPPPEVRLITSRPIIAAQSFLEVRTSADKLVQPVSVTVDPNDPFALVARLPILVEGEYTVNYQISTLGESTVLVGSYKFQLDLPDPILNLQSPTNGEGVAPGPLRLRMQGQFIDFSLYNRRIRVYVDDNRVAEVTNFRFTIAEISPGVHKIRTVLTQFDDEELAETSTTIFVAVAPTATKTDPQAAALQDDSLPGYSGVQWAVMGFAALLLLAIGLWLGSRSELYHQAP